MDNLNIVIVGHVDHGKSTLIGRLLFDTKSLPADQLAEWAEQAGGDIDKVPFAHILDHLEEEREQSITIDTAQTFFSTASRQYIIIDAPGHKEFVKNMVTGAGQADAAVLVVAVDEGIREQTRRHAGLLAMLGLTQVLVVVNKMDQIDWDKAKYDATVVELTSLFAELGLDARGFVPVSAMLGEGMLSASSHMRWYDGAPMLEQLDALDKPARLDGVLAMPVQDVYEFDGRTLVVGRVESGRVATGDAVMVQPDGVAATVASIDVLGAEPTAAEAGECIALTLEGDVTPRRGQVIVAADRPLPVGTTVVARAFWMVDKPLTVGRKMTLSCTTQNLACKVAAIRNRINSASMELIAEQADELAFTEVADLELVTESELVADRFDRLAPLGRFTLNVDDYPCAGGTVLEVR